MANPVASTFHLATTQPQQLLVSANSVIKKMMAVQDLLLQGTFGTAVLGG